jgi:hypothetical protein
MKKANKIFGTIFALLMIGGYASAQNTAGKVDDAGRLALTPWIPPAIEGIPEGAKSLLKTKLSSIATQNGMTGGNSPRFIITANLNVLTKDITPTAPPMTAVTLEVTLCIGDGINGTKFASTSINVKGVGSNENKAYIEAVKQIRPDNAAIQSFVTNGKNKVIEYYNTQCDFIIKTAETAASVGNYEEALYQLTSVPDVCKTCFDKCMTAAGPMYKKYLDKQCKVLLSQARNAWNASQNVDGANAASEYLGQIDPDAACYKDAVALQKEIAARIKALDKREWDFQMKVHNDEVALEKAAIGAYRDVGVAYGNGQPQNVSYNVNGWW